MPSGALDDPSIFAKAAAHVHAERARLAAEVRHGKALNKALKAAKQAGRELSAEEQARFHLKTFHSSFLSWIPS